MWRQMLQYYVGNYGHIATVLHILVKLTKYWFSMKRILDRTAADFNLQKSHFSEILWKESLGAWDFLERMKLV